MLTLVPHSNHVNIFLVSQMKHSSSLLYTKAALCFFSSSIISCSEYIYPESDGIIKYNFSGSSLCHISSGRSICHSSSMLNFHLNTGTFKPTKKELTLNKRISVSPFISKSKRLATSPFELTFKSLLNTTQPFSLYMYGACVNSYPKPFIIENLNSLSFLSDGISIFTE